MTLYLFIIVSTS